MRVAACQVSTPATKPAAKRMLPPWLKYISREGGR